MMFFVKLMLTLLVFTILFIPVEPNLLLKKRTPLEKFIEFTIAIFILAIAATALREIWTNI